MRKIKEILRLRFDNNQSTREIAAISSVSRTTVREYLERAEKHQISWPLPDEMDDEQLEKLLYPSIGRKGEGTCSHPDFIQIHKELKRKGVTLRLLWEEYKETHPGGVQYSRFCDLYRTWAKKRDVWMPQPHKAGEKLFVDYAGQTVQITDPNNGDSTDAQIFVAVLGASNYTYAEATASQALPDWISSHVRAFEFFGGVPELVIPDNLKSGVEKAHRYEPDLNPTYQDLAHHYGVAIDPARVRKPKDKSKVEQAVLDVERRLLAPLRDRQFFSLSELNGALRELLKEFNNRPFQKQEGTRASLFEELEKPVLRPLPTQRYSYAEWESRRVGSDYHVEVRRHRYSVPYKHAKDKVDIRLTEKTVEIFHKGKRIASHIRSYETGGYTTHTEHRPPSHRHHANWTPEKLLEWAKRTGPNTEAWIQSVLEDETKHLRQREKLCLGVLRLSKQYGEIRLEQACRRALYFGADRFKSIESILKKRLDSQPLPGNTSDTNHALPQAHDYIRGAAYYT